MNVPALLPRRIQGRIFLQGEVLGPGICRIGAIDKKSC